MSAGPARYPALGQKQRIRCPMFVLGLGFRVLFFPSRMAEVPCPLARLESADTSTVLDADDRVNERKVRKFGSYNKRTQGQPRRLGNVGPNAP